MDYEDLPNMYLLTSNTFLCSFQIWALQDGTTVVIGGKTNRAKLEFPNEMNRLLDQVPELVGINDSLKSS